jgi:glycerol-3-phosphate acyltransferase PlsY
MDTIKLAELLFPKLAFSGLIAGFAAIVGHNFPFYLHFKGGKGLAAFGGTVLFVNPLFFLILLVFGLILMFIFNFSVVMPMSAGILFPILVYLQSGSLGEAAVASLSSLLIIIMHWSNIEKAKNRTDVPIREFVIKKLFRKN